MKILAHLYIHLILKLRIVCWKSVREDRKIKPYILPKWFVILLHRPDNLIQEFESKRKHGFKKNLQDKIVDIVRTNSVREENII